MIILSTTTSWSSLRSNCQSFILEPVPRVSRHNLTRPEPELADSISQRRAVVVDVARELPAAIALDLGAFPLNPPVIERLEKGSDFVFLLESELGRIHGGEGEGVLVARLEVEVRREEVRGLEVEIGAALSAAVYRRHWSLMLISWIWRWTEAEVGDRKSVV